jgi:MFS family permease
VSPRTKVWLDLGPLYRYRNYRLLYIGQTLSFFGSMLTLVAVPFQVFERTGSSLMVGLLSTAELVPLLITGLFGGVLADTFDRRRLLIGSELLLFCCSLGLCLNAALPAPSLVALFVLAGLMSALNGLHRPSLDALLPRLVSHDDQSAIAALASLRGSVGAIGGPACAGLLLAQAGATWVYALDALTFFISLGCLMALGTLPVAGDREESPFRLIREGIEYARRRPELLGTYIVDLTAMTLAMPMALFASLGQRLGGAVATGWLYSSMAMGALLMTLFSGWTKRIDRHGAAVIWAAGIWGLAVVLLGIAPNLPLAVSCLAVAGAADMVSGLFRMTIWNQTIPDALRGRLAGIEMLSYMTGPLLGNARAGWIASTLGDTTSIVSGGALCVLGVWLCARALPGFARYRPQASG